MGRERGVGERERGEIYKYLRREGKRESVTWEGDVMAKGGVAGGAVDVCVTWTNGDEGKGYNCNFRGIFHNRHSHDWNLHL